VLICGLITETKLKGKKVGKQKIAIVSDHAGYYLKEKLLDYLIKEKYDVKDLGMFCTADSVDYPDFGHPLANAVAVQVIMSWEYQFAVQAMV
jgi:ribose 5-phosphate isomerase RpiB